ncbi:MAG: hypothetical protein Q8L88_01010 [Bacteroidota bacterium]|nr:hypothetical protein [Bacteroidota bacterium]
MKQLVMLLFFSFVMLSCGGYNEGVIQKTEKGQLKFVGNVLQATVSIDDGETFVIDKVDIVYQIKPGTHSIKVYKNNALVVNRNVFVDNGVTMEIEIQ